FHILFLCLLKRASAFPILCKHTQITQLIFQTIGFPLVPLINGILYICSEIKNLMLTTFPKQ
ncbi:MAG: hypothetical protein ACKVG7_06625, partial [Flavobacteriales bacterium]